MEIERRYTAVPAEMIDYFKANPTPPPQNTDGGTHYHVHHHYAAPAAPAVPEGAIVYQGQQKTVAEKVIPWMYAALIGCIVLTICAAVLALFAVIVVAVLAVVVLLGLVVAYIIRAQGDSLAIRAKAEAVLANSERKRDEARAAAKGKKHKRR